MKIVLILSVAILYFLNPIEGARILGVFPGATYSHFILGHTLMKELASRGHEVTVMSPFPQKTPIKNYKDVDLSELLKEYEGMLNFKSFVVHLFKKKTIKPNWDLILIQ